MSRKFNPDFDLTISRDELAQLAPDLLDMLREFVQCGLCRASNTVDRKYLVIGCQKLAEQSLAKFPSLKLNHCGSRTVVV